MKSSPLHVLLIPSWYVNTYNSLSGIFFKEQAEALAKNCTQVGVLSVQPISFKAIWRHRKIDFQFHRYVEHKIDTFQIQFPSIPKLKRVNSAVSLWLGKRLFKSYVNANGLPDIIHLHSYSQGDLVVWIKRTYNIPYVVTEHSSAFARNMLNNSESKKAAKVFQHSSVNIAVSDALCKLLMQNFNRQFVSVPNVVNTDYFVPGHSGNCIYTFLNVAFLGENKGQAMLIEAFATAFKTDPNVRLVIAGDGPCYSNLQGLIKKYDMQKQINLLGRASRAQVLELMQASNAFVLSSKYETFGVVVIEAMSCGLPVVSTRCGGPENIIVNASIGMLCDQSKESLSAAMIEVRSRQESYHPQSIRQYALNHYSENAVVSKLMNIYQTVLTI